MRKSLLTGVSGMVLLSAAAFAQSAQSDEEKAKAFFKNNLEQSASLMSLLHSASLTS